jgi:competence protein ComEC
MKDKIFYLACFGFIVGVFLHSFVFINIHILSFCFLIFLSMCIFFVILKNKQAIFLFTFLLLLLVGILRFNQFEKRSELIFQNYLEKEVVFTGIVSSEPEIKDSSQRIIVQTEDLKNNFKILITDNLDLDIYYGDKLKIKGTLKLPKNFITDTGKEFDYISYLKKDRILYILNYPEIEIISNGNGNKIKTLLFKVKNLFIEKIDYAIVPPESFLMKGLILGEKVSFSKEFKQKFIDIGTIHIVALSGYNITIVSEWIMKLFSFLPFYLSIGIGIFSIMLFILMTGGASTAVRAGIMAVLVLIARATGRTYDVGRALLLTAVIMIALNPMILRYDVSFQLSFIATLAVIYLSPKTEKYFMWVPKKFGLRDVINITCAVYIFVLPFILYKMGNLSLVAIPVNILVLPFIPMTMLLGFLTGFIGFFSYALIIPIGFVVYILLNYEFGVINIFSNISFASVIVPNFSLVLVILIYLYFFYKLFWRNLKKLLFE